MYGISVFLNEDMTEEVRQYIRRMHVIGFMGIFSSIHIPEDDASMYIDRLGQLGAVAQEYAMSLVVDVSGNALRNLGIEYANLTPLMELGVTGIRVDYGVSHEEIALISQQMDVILNASTLTKEDLVTLRQLGVDFKSIEAWHNYYPRPETGLDRDYLIQLNQWLQNEGIKVMAFVSGEEDLRGPLYEGLPTLETHRYRSSLAGAIELRKDCYVDKVFIGDPGISHYSQIQWEKYLSQAIIYFEGIPVSDNEVTLSHAEGLHTQRIDLSRDVIRSQESRLERKISVQPALVSERPVGTITVDNASYLRYEGEVQITKNNLKADEKVNVIGHVQERDLLLLSYIQPGQQFEIKWKRG